MPWLTTIGALPLVGAAAVWLLPSRSARPARATALVASLITLLATMAMAYRFDTADAGTHQFAEQHRWIAEFGVNYAVGIDGLALVMIVLSALLVPICVLAGWNQVEGSSARHYFGLILVLETFMIGVFAARDLFLFYVLFEAMLIPVYFLIGLFGGAQRRYAAVKFLLYSLLGGLVMLVAMIYLYVEGPGGPDGFLISELTGLEFSSELTGRLLFCAFFFAFAIKAPMWPVHTWLPDAASQAPPGVAVLLVGVLDKVGTFGMLTLCLPLFPDASRWATPVVLVLAVVSVLYGGLLAIGQVDLLRMIAYTSVSHFGLIVIGVFAMTSSAQSGAALYMLNHGFSTGALFLVAGMLIARRGSARIADYGGLQRSTPLLAGTFLLAGLSSLALPGLSSFISEFLVLVGTYGRYPGVAVVAAGGMVLAALYILLTYQRMFTGPVKDFATGWRDMNLREGLVMAPLIAAIVALGFFPKPVLDVLNPVADRTLQQVSMTDPAPSAAGEESTTEGTQP
jgi:NADH-quinone oxidoreductase subunit M